MSTSLTIQCAIDVTNLLTSAPSGTFSVAFTPQRLYAPIYELSNGQSIAVYVTAASLTETFLSRKTTDGENEVDIAVLQRLSKPDDPTEIDPLMMLPEQIMAFLKSDDANGDSRRVLPCGAKLVKVQNKPLYSPSDLQTKQTLISVITLTYEAFVDFR